MPVLLNSNGKTDSCQTPAETKCSQYVIFGDFSSWISDIVPGCWDYLAEVLFRLESLGFCAGSVPAGNLFIFFE